MSNFDNELKTLLREEDDAFIKQSLEETGFYSEAFGSLKGQGNRLFIFTWVGIFIFSAVLIFSIWKFFHVQTVREQILFAALAVMANSAQIALKMFFNMRLNRRAIIREIKRLQLVLAKP